MAAQQQMMESKMAAQQQIIDNLIAENHFLGRWSVEVGDFKAIWEFKENNIITSTSGTSTGKWSIRDTEIMIEWERNVWESFRFINQNEARGDSWRGKNLVSAKKL